MAAAAERDGARVWVRCGRRAWTRGTLVERKEGPGPGKWSFRVRKDPVDDDSNDSHDGYDEEDEEVVIEGDSADFSSHNDIYLCNEFDDGRTLADVDDLTWLTHLHEPSILQALSDRFDKDLIYTNTGPILLAVNPFKRLKIYSEELLGMYYSTGLLRSQGLEAPSLGPHVFATGDAAYRSLVDTTEAAGAKNQSILVSGESGAGKTESTKFIMQYLATVAKDDKEKDGQKIADMVLQSNPILEAFGNARTTRNDNSSRFGKFIEMQFNARGMLVGARIVTYLLEKVRLAKQGIGERNFHVFYQLVRGAPEEKIQEWRVPELDQCGITNQSECLDRQDGVDDDDQYLRMWKAMETMGFPDEEKEQLMRVVSAVMNLGNLVFLPDENSANEEGSVLDEDSAAALEACGELLRVDKDALLTALTTRKIKAGLEWFTKRLNDSEASDARDALAKAVYSRMFDHVVKRVNESIQVSSRVKTNFIGVLDIFGFEVFQSNSFEQLCINYANETLQQQFNQFVFKLEQREYEKEKIKWSFIDFPDNQKCLDLIEAKPIGIISLLDEQCLFPQGNDKSLAGRFYEKLIGVDRFAVSNKEKVNNHFTVEHYAGDVSYDTYGFIAKNKDQLYQESLELMEVSEDPLLKLLFPKPKASAKDASGGSKVQQKTVGSQFKEQLAALLKTIRSTSPHYVRCLKPNDVAAPGKIVRGRLVDQLRYGGVLEAVKVARAGYPVRMLLADFCSRYFMLGGPNGRPMDVQRARKDGDGKPAALKIVEAVKLEAEVEYQVGITKLFLRKSAYQKIEDLRLSKMKGMATRIQAAARGQQAARQYRETLRSCRTLQRVIRGFLGRAEANRVREHRAAVRIQTAARGSLARAARTRAIRAVLRTQAAFRAYRGRKARTELRRDKAAMKLQAWYRAAPFRRSFLLMRRAVVVLQTIVRGGLARMELKRLRVEAKQVGNLQSKLQELQARVQVLEGELAAERAAHEALKASASSGDSETAVAAAAAAAEPFREQISQLEKNLTSTTAELQAANEKAEGLQAQLVALQAQVAAAAASNLDANDAAPAATPAGEDADELGALRAALVEAQERNAEYASKIDRLVEASASDNTAVARIAELEAALEKAQTNAPSAEIPAPTSDDAAQERIAALEAEVNALRVSAQVPKGADVVARSHKDEAAVAAPEGGAGVEGNPELAQLREEVELLRAALAKTANGDAAPDIEPESNGVASPMSPTSPGASEVAGLKAHIAFLESSLHEATELNQSYSEGNHLAGANTEQLIKANKRIEDVEQENAALIQQLEQHVGRMCDAENRANELHNDYNNLRRQNKALEEEMVEIQQEKNHLEEKLQAMETMHMKASGVKIALARRLEELILKNRSLEAEKLELEELSERLKQDVQLLRAQVG